MSMATAHVTLAFYTDNYWLSFFDCRTAYPEEQKLVLVGIRLSQFEPSAKMASGVTALHYSFSQLHYSVLGIQKTHDQLLLM